MIVLGVVLLLLGFFLNISILWILGVVLTVVGAVFAISGASGRAIAGRKHWF
ncbi:hypothetical protein ACWEV3_14565 [Saccharopolyspora sp. NPDC003752]